MKQERIFNSLFKVGLLLCSMLLLNGTLSAQTYCYQFFEKPVVGTNLDVDVYITPSSDFNLGNARIVFSYNSAALSLTNPLIFTSNLDATKYTTTAKKEVDGIVTIDITYNGIVGNGTPISSFRDPFNAPLEGFKIGTIRFGVLNSTIARDFRLVRRQIKQTFLSKDDNTSVLPSSLQCPPSPYTSLFYDVNVELNAAIPMDECVEPDEPGSVKIPVLGDDETREILPPGFRFKFYCEEVTSLRLGADGALLVNANPNNTSLPTTNNGKLKTLGKAIAPLWDEWTKGMGTINCLVRSLPNRKRMLIVQWNNVSPVDNITGNNLNTDPMKATFNMVIFEDSSIVKFNYKDVDFLRDIGVGANLIPIADRKRNGADGSVGIKGLCATGTADDGVNNILYDGPTGISLFDVRTRKVYKSITFLPISEACIVPNAPSNTIVCQGTPAFRLEVISSAVNGKWTGTGTPYLDNPNVQAAKFNPTTAGNFTLNWEPDCSNLGYTVNVIVNPQAAANAGRDTSVCSNNTLKLNGTIGGAATSATWSVPLGLGTFSNPNALDAIFTPNLNSGTVTLTLTTNDPDGPCPAATSTLTVTVKQPAEAGTDGIRNICGDDINTTIRLYEMINGEQTGGTWTRVSGIGGTFDPFVGTFKLTANTTTSKFKYVILGNKPCPDDSSFATINITPPPSAGTSGSTTVCENSTAPLTLADYINGEQSGGIWTRIQGDRGTFNAATGTFTPAIGATTSIFRYVVTGMAPCDFDEESLVTVNIIPQAKAGEDGDRTVCDNSTQVINLFSLISNEQAGGIWTRLTGSGGNFNATNGTFAPAIGSTTSTFKYTVTSLAPCPSVDDAIATVNIVPQANAGTSNSRSICSDDIQTINLFDIITGEQSGGTWIRIAGTGGTFDATNGRFTPDGAAINTGERGDITSAFRYTVTVGAPCSTVSESVAIINIVPKSNAGSDGSTTICASATQNIDLFSLISNEQPGGIWSRVLGNGGSLNPSSGNFNPTGATTSTFKYTIGARLPCTQIDDATVIVTIAPEANAGTGSIKNICSDDTRPINLFELVTGEQTGGTWTRISGTNGNFNATTGTFTPSVSATSSTFRYTITGILPCPSSTADVTINISPKPFAGDDDGTTLCDNAVVTINLRNLIANEQNGGTWMRISGIGGIFNAANGTFSPENGTTTSQFKYTIVGQSPCSNDEAIATVTMKPAAYAGTDDGTILCDYVITPINLFLLINGEQTGGTWTRISGAGGTFDATNGTFTPARGATSSRFQYLVRGAAPCPDDIAIATVDLVPQADAGQNGGRTLCNKNLGTINLFDIIENEQPGGTWERTEGTGGTFNATNGTFTPSVSSTNSVFRYRVSGTLPCVDDFSFATINLVTPPDAGSDGTYAICDSDIRPIDLFNYITGEQSGGTWTRISGTGGAFFANSGRFVPALGATSSIFRYNITGNTPCIDDFSEVNIIIRPQPNAGEDANITVCDNSTAIINLFSRLRNAQTGGYWNRLTGVGGTFDPFAGTFIPAAGAVSSTFQYTVKGQSPCIDDNAILTINIVPTRTPEFDPIPPFCQGVFPIPLLQTTSKNGITGTWSPQFINNQIPGIRTYTFTATNTACVTPATLTITVYPIPDVNAGPDQTYCNNPASQFDMDASAIPAGGTGFWSFVGNAYSAIITDINDPKTKITNLEAGKTITLRWTVKSREGCPNSDDVIIGKGINPPVIVTYDKNSVLAGTIGDLGKGDAWVCANIVIKELTDDCTSYDELFANVSIIRDEENTSRRYRPDFPKCIQVTCRDVNKKIPTQVWVVDKDGNASFRITYITIQDNMGFCGPTPQTTIAVATNSNLPVRNVTITATLNGENQSLMDTLSNNNGFAILKNLALGDTFTLRASKTDDKYWGVSTYDIAVISQHIVGINPITSPSVLLAADVNEDGEVDAQDMVIIRNFILRRTQNLPKRDWRFIDSSYVFQDPIAPFFENEAEIIRLDNSTPINHKAFKAIKKGDVTPQLTQPLNAFNPLTARNNRSLTLQTEDIFVEKGKTYAIPFIAENFDAKAFQFTLNTEGVTINSIEAGDLPNLSESQFAIFDKAMTVSWNGKSNTKSPHVFTLRITAKKADLLSNILKINSLITNTEANDSQGEVMPIHLQFNKTTSRSTAFHLYQNYPNPFGNTTTIAFDLPKDASTRLSVMTIDGKIIYTQEGKYSVGFNSITLDKNVLNTTGILYYRIEAGEHSAVQRMVVLK
jgi:hypothetical protein